MLTSFNSEHFVSGKFQKRYKRFFADVELETGEVVTAHCRNPGRMTSCLGDGWPVLMTNATNPKRKLKYTLEYMYNGDTWIGVNTNQANKIVEKALKDYKIDELGDYTAVKKEVAYSEKSRVVFLLEYGCQIGGAAYYLEVKSVTLLEDGSYKFPDAPSERARKHLHELRAMVDSGHRAGILFLVQRDDGGVFKPADQIDPQYAELLTEVTKNGVDIMVYSTTMGPLGRELDKQVPYVLSK